MDSSAKHSNDEEKGTDETAEIARETIWISRTGTFRFLIADIALLGISILPSDLLYWWNHSSNLHSVLINPVYTLRHVREAAAIRLVSLPRFGSSVFARAYRGRRIHLPPLWLALVELVFLQEKTKGVISLNTFPVVFFILQMDKWIAQRLEQLALRILQREEEDHANEIRIQEHDMDPKIRPQQMDHLFPTSSNASPSASFLVEWKDIPQGDCAFVLLQSHFHFGRELRRQRGRSHESQHLLLSKFARPGARHGVIGSIPSWERAVVHVVLCVYAGRINVHGVSLYCVSGSHASLAKESTTSMVLITMVCGIHGHSTILVVPAGGRCAELCGGGIHDALLQFPTASSCAQSIDFVVFEYATVFKI